MGYCTASVPSGSHGAAAPLVLWYGARDLATHPDLYKEQLTRLGATIDQRLAGDAKTRASGLIVNAFGEIEDAEYECRQTGREWECSKR